MTQRKEAMKGFKSPIPRVAQQGEEAGKNQLQLPGGEAKSSWLSHQPERKGGAVVAGGI